MNMLVGVQIPLGGKPCHPQMGQSHTILLLLLVVFSAEYALLVALLGSSTQAGTGSTDIQLIGSSVADCQALTDLTYSCYQYSAKAEIMTDLQLIAVAVLSTAKH